MGVLVRTGRDATIIVIVTPKSLSHALNPDWECVWRSWMCEYRCLHFCSEAKAAGFVALRKKIKHLRVRKKRDITEEKKEPQKWSKYDIHCS